MFRKMHRLLTLPIITPNGSLMFYSLSFVSAVASMPAPPQGDKGEEERVRGMRKR